MSDTALKPESSLRSEPRAHRRSKALETLWKSTAREYVSNGSPARSRETLSLTTFDYFDSLLEGGGGCSRLPRLHKGCIQGRIIEGAGDEDSPWLLPKVATSRLADGPFAPSERSITKTSRPARAPARKAATQPPAAAAPLMV